VEKLKVGVVGVGYFGRFHAEKYAKMEDVELVGVVDVDESRAREVAKRCRTRPFARYADLFENVQAVSIAIPTPFHYSVTKECFLRGVDVLLEKPIASTLKEADALITLSESKGLILQIGHLERFNGALSALEGKVQHPLFIESHRLGPFSGRGAEVNVVLDLMVHDLDIILSLVDAKEKKFQAIGIPMLTPTPDVANARIEFENGCTADLTVSRVSEEKIRRTRIFQADEILSIDYLSQKLSLAKTVFFPGKKKMPEMVIEEIPVEKVDLLETEIRSFLESVKNRKRPRVSGTDGRRTLEVALRIIRKIDDPNKRKR
jgi:predicted dehydrogenase